MRSLSISLCSSPFSLLTSLTFPQAFSNRREAVELETTASLVAVVLSPWIITVAIGVVSFFKGEGRLVWNYREVWGESKGEVGDGEEAKRSVLRAGEEKREHEVLSV